MTHEARLVINLVLKYRKVVMRIGVGRIEVEASLIALSKNA